MCSDATETEQVGSKTRTSCPRNPQHHLASWRYARACSVYALDLLNVGYTERDTDRRLFAEPIYLNRLLQKHQYLWCTLQPVEFHHHSRPLLTSAKLLGCLGSKHTHEQSAWSDSDHMNTLARIIFVIRIILVKITFSRNKRFTHIFLMPWKFFERHNWMCRNWISNDKFLIALWMKHIKSKV